MDIHGRISILLIRGELIVDIIWEEMYNAAKAVLKPVTISDYVSAGEVSAAVRSKSGKIRSVGAIIAENYNITKEKTDFSAARLQNSAYAELNSAFK